MDATAVAEAKAYLRVDGTAEDALVGTLIESALALCEGFVGQVPIVRTATLTVPATAEWRRLPLAPVRAVTLVEGLSPTGVASALPVNGYAVDINGWGEAWVRATASGPPRLRVTAEVGLAADWAGLPAGLRQGMVRLVAHLFARRDGDEAGPPAAVAALWRPWRRTRLS